LDSDIQPLDAVDSTRIKATSETLIGYSPEVGLYARHI